MSSSNKKEQEPVFRLVCSTIFDMDFDFEKMKDKVQFYCKGREICPTTGRPHWQCFFYAGVGKRKATWLKLLKPWHTEMCVGNLLQNEDYCTKDGKWEEWGVKPMGNGMKRCLLAIKDEIDAGKSVHEVMEHPDAFETCLRYKKGLHEYETYKRTKEIFDRGYLKKHVEVIIGPTNKNKSRVPRDIHGYADLYPMPDNKGQWAGSYRGQPAVLFDDVCAGDIMPISHFLRITDGYPIEVAIKGGFVAWAPTHIYFTSNESVEEWWPDAKPEHLAAVRRRITKLTNHYLSDE